MSRQVLGAALLAAVAVAGVLAVRPGTEAPPKPPPKPQRIIALTLASAEVLLELVPQERIAAVHEIAARSSHSNVRDRVRGIPLVASEVERIAALDPDLVLTASYVRKEFVEQLTRARLPVVTLTEFTDLEAVLRTIEKLGDVVGEPVRARSLVLRVRTQIEAIQASITKGAPPPRVISLGETGATAGAGTTFHSLVLLAGARNAAAENGIRGFGTVSAEQVVLWDPDVIVVGKDPDTGASLKEKILSDPAYLPLRRKKIVEISYPHFTCVSHYLVEGLRELVRGLYP